MILYHGSKIVVESPEIRIQKYEASVECVGRKIRYGQHLPERGASPS